MHDQRDKKDVSYLERVNAELTDSLRRAHRFRSLGTIGERLPGGFGPAATLAHMLERRRFPLGPRLFGPGEEELEV